MNYVIVGFKNVDYVRKDNTECHGVEFHLMEQGASSLENGCAVCTVFLSKNQLQSCGCTAYHVGDECNLIYQLNGRVPRLVGINIL